MTAPFDAQDTDVAPQNDFGRQHFRARFLDTGGSVYNVKAFGAVGDGVTDDTAAIQEAINALPAWGTLYFPPGNYVVAGSLDLSTLSRAVFRGENGSEATTYNTQILFTAGSGTLFNGYSASVNKIAIQFRDLNMRSTLGGGTAIRLNAERQQIIGCTFAGFATGLQLSDAGSSVVETVVDRCVFDACTSYGIYVDGTSVTDGMISRCVVAGASPSSGVGIRLARAWGWSVQDTHIYNVATQLKVDGGSEIRILGCHFDGVDGIGIDLTQDTVVEGSVIAGNAFDTTTTNAVLIKLTMNSSSRIVIVGNILFAQAGTLGTVGIQQAGAGTLYGLILGNSVSTTLATRFSSVSASAEFLDASLDVLLTRANTLKLSSWSATPVQLTSDGSGNLNYSTGALTISGGNVIIGSNAGPYRSFNMNRAAGVGVQLVSKTAGLNRWVIELADSGAESGSDAGSDFNIYRYGDAGNFLATPISIKRSDGTVTISSPLHHTGATVGFYNHAVTSQQLLATGAGHTVDDVITALQNLGLVKQA